MFSQGLRSQKGAWSRLSLASGALCVLCLASACNLTGTRPQSLRGVIKGPPQGLLRLNGLGEARVGKQRVYLPRAAEFKRYGVVVVDLSPIPSEWRPPHLSDGGLAIAALYEASPLALAGLRKLDRLLKINDQPARIGDLTKIFKRYDHLRLEVKRPWGEIALIEARAEDNIHDEDERFLTGLFHYRRSSVESEFYLGPLGAFFSRSQGHRIRREAFKAERRRLRLLKDQVAKQHASLRLAEGRLLKGEEAKQTEEMIAQRRRLDALERQARKISESLHERYYEYFRWSILAGIFVYESEIDAGSEAKKSRWTFFHFIKFGDDIREGEAI